MVGAAEWGSGSGSSGGGAGGARVVGERVAMSGGSFLFFCLAIYSSFSFF